MSDIINLLLKDELTCFWDALVGAGVQFFENRSLDAADYVPMNDEAIAELIFDYVMDQEFKSCYNCARAEVCAIYWWTFVDDVHHALQAIWRAMPMEDAEAVRHIVANAIGERCRHHTPSEEDEDA